MIDPKDYKAHIEKKKEEFFTCFEKWDDELRKENRKFFLFRDRKRIDLINLKRDECWYSYNDPWILY